MANLSQQQVKDIISKAPIGTSPAGIVAALRGRGHVLEGYPTEEIHTVEPKTSPQSFGSAASQAGQEFRQRAEEAAEDREQGKSNIGEQVLRTAGAMGTGAVKAVSGTFMEAAKALAGKRLEKAAGAVVGKVGEVASPVIQPVIQQWSKLYEDLKVTNPRLAKDLLGLLELGTSATAIASAPAIGTGLAKGTVGTVGGVGKGVGKTAKLAKKTISKAAEKKMASKTARLEEMLSPVETKETIREAAAMGKRSEGGIIKSPKIEISPETKRLSESVSRNSDVSPKLSMQKNATNTRRAITVKSEKEMRPLLKSNRQGFNSKQIGKKFNDLIENPDTRLQFTSAQGGENLYEKIIQEAKYSVDKFPKNAEGLWKAKVDFANRVKNLKPSAFEGTTNFGQAVINVNKVFKNMIGGLVKNPKEVNRLFDELSDLYEANAIFAEKAAMLKKGKVGEFLKRHPTATKASKYGVGAVGLGIAGKVGINMLE